MPANIGTRTAYVRSLLGGRADLDSEINLWLAAAYTELGMAYPLETLESTPALSLLVVGVDFLAYPTDVRAVKNLLLIDTNGTTPKWNLKKKNITVIESYTTVTKGTPVIWAPFNETETANIYLRPVPDKAYYIRWRTWIKPLIAATVADTSLLLPEDWMEILDYAAAIRGHIRLGEQDKAGAIQQLLHGAEDPRSGRRYPGLIAQKLMRRQAEFANEDYALTPTR